MIEHHLYELRAIDEAEVGLIASKDFRLACEVPQGEQEPEFVLIHVSIECSDLGITDRFFRALDLQLKRGHSVILIIYMCRVFRLCLLIWPEVYDSRKRMGCIT